MAISSSLASKLAYATILLSTHIYAFKPGVTGVRKVSPQSPPQAISIPADETFVSYPETELKEDYSWIQNLDYEVFGKEVTALGKKLQRDISSDDVDHLNKILGWRNLAAFVGVATMWSDPNPLTIIALSTWTYSSWTMVAHHTCHGGYNRVDAGKYNSRGFGLGTIPKRIADWCDWMLPEAWNVEHNRLHHYHLGEDLDPDLVERNLKFLRDMDVPMPVKYAVVAFFMPVWKWFYYAPNTFKELQISKMRAEKKELPDIDFTQAFTIRTMLFPETETEKELGNLVNSAEFFTNVLGPFLVSRFILLPAPLLLLPNGLGSTCFGHAVVSLIAAELLTNIHAFITIVTNHAGEDLYVFDDEVKPKSGSFYVRQIVSSTNYATGTDAVDFAHGWLNYQIEHHVWPDLSMLQYQRGAPVLKALCEKHGVPYVQESVWTRLRKTVDIMVGKTSMMVFPTKLEPAKDKALKGVKWASTNGAIDEE
mmetsp:Transcript_10997/g.16095  ORF Transcript_10997/g.16095 Transcript_10997/m.16095 type:complete len:480 (-) Transcript_10997:290-1729(-)|eukprot:CAMPEP_0195526126 /NCGR_PEP_ID=MMETSP0794_2-20130614/27016_1 /TAXON_ID=515487 /ORGANISM="Stephanopyxis turris, Strain CCMP 815" /LENGTH=479 /DNA_ID=CAMNT_0040656745 /DNA_START=168 /DNA_END=1607 /DNA_ORIENTATION=+